MGAFIAKRVASAAGIQFLDIQLIVSVIHLALGYPALMIVGGERGISANFDTVMQQQLGLNKPLQCRAIPTGIRREKSDPQKLILG